MPAGFRTLAVSAVVHAAVVLAIWLAQFAGDLYVIPARWWLGLAWLWIVWPVLLVLHPARTTKRVLVPLAIGVVLLLPCASTIFTFTVWAVEGFAP